MENASKALLMAGGILIALLIISSLVLMFTKLQDYQNSQDAKDELKVVEDFNKPFLPYDDDSRKISFLELKSLDNLLIEYENKYGEEYKITAQPTIQKLVEDIVSTYCGADGKSSYDNLNKCSNWFTYEQFQKQYDKIDALTKKDDYQVQMYIKGAKVIYDGKGGRASKIEFGDVGQRSSYR